MAQHQEDADHQIVEDFFRTRGFKTPDFKIRRADEVVAFCEVKSPQDVFIDRVEESIRRGQAGTIEIGCRNDYRQARCINLIRAAAKSAAQLAGVNAGHTVPNIFMIVNRDTVSLYDDFS